MLKKNFDIKIVLPMGPLLRSNKIIQFSTHQFFFIFLSLFELNSLNSQ